MPSLAATQSRTVGNAEDIRKRTHEVLDILPDSDVQRVFSYAQVALTADSPMKPLVEDELLAAIDRSIVQSQNGEHQDMDEALDEISAELGI
ncbi:MAG: hypothetical protein IJ679_08775 [Lachnospiraceae bacterium]|nr:hypothetical protein [Lachnospiraceae bacterium]